MIELKGSFYWSDDIPNKASPHFIVVASNANQSGKVLVIPISSVKTSADGSEKFYDKSCIVLPEDILKSNGEKILTKKSFVRYQYACEMDAQKLLQNAFSGVYKFHTRVSKDFLRRVQEGAKVSEELEPRFQKYFVFF